jgi:siroheme synthase-like protein
MKSKKREPITYCPIFLDLREKHCVVVGAGEVAQRKIRMLLECGAKVKVISPTVRMGVSQLVKAGIVDLQQMAYRTGDLKNAAVVISATSRRGTNQAVEKEARRRGILINVVDDPGHSDFIVPSFFRRGGLTIAISTSGTSPALARRIRTKLEADFGAEYVSLLTLVEEVRSELKEKKVKVSAQAWQKALDLDGLIDLVRSRRTDKAKTMLLLRLKTREGKD